MIGLDPNQICEFTHAGATCRSRYLTIRQVMEISRLRDEAGRADTDTAAAELIGKALACGMVCVNGRDPSEYADCFTMREAFELLWTWPAEVARLESDLKKASPSP